MPDDALPLLLPRPLRLTPGTGRLPLGDGLRFEGGVSLLPGTAKLLERALRNRDLTTTDAAPRVAFRRVPELGTEAHRLIVQSDGVRIEHGCPRAALHAVATLGQLVRDARPAGAGNETEATPSLPHVTI